MGGHLSGRGITVVGGGIAGLSVARALARRGASVEVLEQAHEIAEVGAGLQLSPNGMRVIDALGLGEALRAASLRAEAVELIDGATGRRVLRLDLAGGEFRLVHRARLIEVLHAGALDAGAGITLGRRVEPEDLDGPELVLGADGLNSVVRTEINGPSKPFFTGQAAWRAVVAEDASAPPVVQVFMGPGRHLVTYPLAGGLRNIVAVEERTQWTAEGWHHRDDPEAPRAAFAGMPPVRELLRRVGTVHLWGLFRHPVAARWHRGPLAILGDAAHPTLPFLAQGANMGLEDAWVLAACLEANPGGEALARYQTLRRERTAQIVAAANANARNYHLRGPVKAAAHFALRLGGALAPGAALRRFGWVYDYDATRDE